MMKLTFSQELTLLIYFLLAFMSSACQEPSNDVLQDFSHCNLQLYPAPDTVISTHTAFAKTHFRNRIDYFRRDSIPEGSIIMLGNSLTEEGGNWASRLNHTPIVNRGIKGDNTDGIKARLGELICASPKAVFLMIGTNDLWTSYSSQKIAEQIHEIGFSLAQELPLSKVIVQTIMPLGAENEKKSKVLAINESLRAYDSTNYILIDTFEHMADENGDLPAQFTTDGVHLTSQGYGHWAVLLNEYIHVYIN